MKRRIMIISAALVLMLLAGAVFVFGGGNKKELAINSALSHAGFTENDVKFLTCTREMDDLRVYFNVSFYADGTEYEYEVLPDGTLVDADRDRIF